MSGRRQERRKRQRRRRLWKILGGLVLAGVLCFCGLVGYVLIVAMPDRGKEQRVILNDDLPEL